MKSDNDLIDLFVKNNDKNAYVELVKRHQSAIRQFLRRVTAGDYHLADDIAQETFLLMYRKLYTFNSKSALTTWLHKIAYNCFLKHLQSEKITESLEDYHFEHIDCVHVDLTTDIMLEQMMKQLSVDERLVLTLSYSAGMSHGEIVQVTDFPLGTVKSHINRAKTKLAKIISAEGKV